MSISIHETTIRQWVKNHTKDEIALFFEDQFVRKDAEITRLRNLVAEKDAEIERLKAENEELRREIGGFPHLSDMRQCMIDTAGDNERLKKALDQAIHIGGIGFVRRTRKLNDWYDDTNHIESDPGTTSSRSTEYPELARYLEEMGKKE